MSRNDALREAIEAGAKALYEAAEELMDWGTYAPVCFQDKHDLDGAIKAAKDAAAALCAALAAPQPHVEKRECMNCVAFGGCHPNNDAGRCGYEAQPEPVGSVDQCEACMTPDTCRLTDDYIKKASDLARSYRFGSGCHDRGVKPCRALVPKDCECVDIADTIDALLAERERLTQECSLLAAGHCIHDDGSGLTADEGGTPYCAMKKERDALRADAERYRWLRDNPWPSPEFASIIQEHRNAVWDAAIDAAMKEQS